MSTDAPPEGSTSPQQPDSATEEPTCRELGRILPAAWGQLFPAAGPRAWRSLYDYRLPACSGPSPQGVPMRESRHFLATIWLMRTGERGRGAMKQRDHAVSQTSSQDRKCHSLVSVDIEHAHLMQKEEKEGKPS